MIAAAGPRRRELAREMPARLRLPDGFHAPRLCLPGVLAVQGPPFTGSSGRHARRRARVCVEQIGPAEALAGLPLVVLVDDSDFAARHLNNWLWVTFTRSNPAQDVHGVGASLRQKHWGCTGRW